MADDIGENARPDWRDASSYDYTRDLTAEGWAWEFLRRNPRYCGAWRESCSGDGPETHASGGVRVIESHSRSTEAAAWGLLTFRGPGVERARRRRALAS